MFFKKSILAIAISSSLISGHSMAQSSCDDSKAYQLSETLLDKNKKLSTKLTLISNKLDGTLVNELRVQNKNEELNSKILALNSEIIELTKKYKGLQVQYKASRDVLKNISGTLKALNELSEKNNQINKILSTNEESVSSNSYELEKAQLEEPRKINQVKIKNQEVDYLDLLEKEIATKKTSLKGKKQSDKSKYSNPKYDIPDFEAYFTKQGKPIRIKPTTASKIIDTTKKGMRVLVVKKYLSWYQISDGSWVHSSLLRAVK